MAARQLQTKKYSVSNIVTFIILWHFFFASSFVLRLNPKIFWPLAFLVSIGVALYNRVQLEGAELEILSFSFLGFFLCFFSADPWTAISNELYFFIYLCVAAMIHKWRNHKGTNTILLCDSFDLYLCASTSSERV